RRFECDARPASKNYAERHSCAPGDQRLASGDGSVIRWKDAETCCGFQRSFSRSICGLDVPRSTAGSLKKRHDCVSRAPHSDNTNLIFEPRSKIVRRDRERTHPRLYRAELQDQVRSDDADLGMAVGRALWPADEDRN